MTTTPLDLGRSARKRQAILDAAERVFLRDGYAGANMDALTAEAGVSKQTVYKHFGSKEALFVDLVTAMTQAAGDGVHGLDGEPAPDGDVAAYLRAYADQQLANVLDPRVLRLRRLVIGEGLRFPGLAKAMFDHGPRRAVRSLTKVIADLARRGLLDVDDPALAAETLNWLVMGQPVNEAMLLGDRAVPSRARRQRHVAHAVRVFLAAYGPAGSTRPAPPA